MKAKVMSAKLPSREHIAICAYLIWEGEGCPDGRDLMHWLEAEMQLSASCIRDAGLSQRGNGAHWNDGKAGVHAKL